MDHIFSALQEHEPLFTSHNMYELAKILTIPLLLFYFMLLLAFISIAATPFLIYNFVKTRNDIGDQRHFNKSTFCLKSISTMIFVILTAFSATGCIQMALTLDKGIRDNLVNTSFAIKQAHCHFNMFSVQLDDFYDYTNTQFKTANCLINHLPESVSKKIVDCESNNQLNNVHDNLVNIFLQLSNNQINAIEDNNNVELIEKAVNYIQDNFTVINNTISPKNQEVKEFLIQYSIMHDEYKLPDLLKVYSQLESTLYDLPEVIDGLKLGQKYFDIFQNNTKNDNTYFMEQIGHLNWDVTTILNKVNDIFQAVFSNFSQLGFLESAIDDYTLKLKKQKLVGSLYWSTLLLLVPGIHSMMYVLFSMAAFVAAMHDTSEQKRNVMNSFGQSRICKSAMIIKLSNLFGVALLWAGLLLAASCYLLSLTTRVSCMPMETGHLYSDYLDNKQLWQNKTWLDKNLGEWGHNYYLQDVLQECSNNRTIFDAFKVSEHWNLEKLFHKYELNMYDESVRKNYEKAMKNIKIPDTEIKIKMKNELKLAEKQLADNFTDDIIFDIEILKQENLKQKVIKLMDSLAEKKTVKVFLERILYCLDILEKENVKNTLELLVNLAQNLRKAQEEMYKAVSIELKIANIMQNNSTHLIEKQLIDTQYRMDEVKEQLKSYIIYKTQKDVGKCSFIPDFLNTQKDVWCNKMLHVLDVTWLVLFVNAIFMIVTMFLTNCLTKHLIRAQYANLDWDALYEYMHFQKTVEDQLQQPRSRDSANHQNRSSSLSTR